MFRVLTQNLEQLKQKGIYYKKLTKPQKKIFDYIFGDTFLLSYNNTHVRMLDQSEQVRNKIAVHKARGEILAFRDRKYGLENMNQIRDDICARARFESESKDDTDEFWKFLQDYYALLLIVNYDAEKIKQTLIYDIKFLALNSQLFRSLNPYPGYSASRHLQRIVDKHTKRDGEINFLVREAKYDPTKLLDPHLRGEVRASAQAFDQEVLKTHPLRSVNMIKWWVGLLVFALAVATAACLAGGEPLVTIFVGGLIGLFSGLPAAQYAGEKVRLSNQRNEKFLVKEKESQEKLLRDNVELRLVEYIDPREEGEQIELYVRKNIIPEPQELIPVKEEKEGKREAKSSARQQEKKTMPKGQKPKESSVPRSMPQPQIRINFGSDLVYDSSLGDGCPVKRLSHGSGRFFGCLNVQALKEQKVDAKEIGAFQGVVNVGKIIPSSDLGRPGIKSLAEPLLFFSVGTGKQEWCTTKLKIGSGSRVLGHRVPEVDGGPNKLDVYDTYLSAKQAHRLL